MTGITTRILIVLLTAPLATVLVGCVEADDGPFNLPSRASDIANRATRYDIPVHLIRGWADAINAAYRALIHERTSVSIAILRRDANGIARSADSLRFHAYAITTSGQATWPMRCRLATTPSASDESMGGLPPTDRSPPATSTNDLCETSSTLIRISGRPECVTSL